MSHQPQQPLPLPHGMGQISPSTNPLEEIEELLPSVEELFGGSQQATLPSPQLAAQPAGVRNSPVVPRVPTDYILRKKNMQRRRKALYVPPPGTTVSMVVAFKPLLIGARPSVFDNNGCATMVSGDHEVVLSEQSDGN